MILDILARLANAQAFTDSDLVSENTYNLQQANRRVGTGTKLSLVFVITTAAAGDSASLTDTCRFMAVEDSQASLATAREIISRLVPAADLAVGAIIEVPLPSQTPTLQYLGAKVDLGTGDTVSADCYVIPSDQVQAFFAHAKGYSV